MKTRNKQTIRSIVMILLLTLSTFAALMLSIPTASGHTPAWNIPTYAYVSASPNTVGVGQSSLIVMWLDKYPPTSGGGGGDLWRGFKIDITKPDGTKETIPYTAPTSQVASAWIDYRPTQVGDYSIVFSWPGQTLTNGTGTPNPAGIPYVGDFFMPATSSPVILHVQQTAVAEWPDAPVPTGYWNRPLNTANRESSQLASNWALGSWFRYSNFQESGQAPNSAHILYTKQIIIGGIADERYGSVKYDVNNYESYFSPNPIIMNGQIYISAGTYPRYGYYAMDLKTGEVLWRKNGTDNGLNNPVTLAQTAGGGANGPLLTQTFPQLTNGQLYHYKEMNGEGVLPYLWMVKGSTWYMLDANTGNLILTLVNVPGGTGVTDQDGSILRFSYSAATGQFLCWNSSQSIPPGGPTGTAQVQWKPPVGAVIDAVNDTTWTKYGPLAGQWDASDILPRSGYTMNVTGGPRGLPALNRVLQDSSYKPQLMFFNNMNNLPSFGSSDMTFQAAAVRIDYGVAPYSPFPGKTFTQNNNFGYGVTLMWNKTIQKPLGGNLTFSQGPVSYEEKVFTLWSKETMQWWGYSLNDGSLLWGPTKAQGAWDMYGSGGFYAYGTLFSGSYGGVLYAYDIKTGNLKWNYTLAEIGHESPYGNFQCTVGGAADGKIFIYSMEHSPTQPLWRGSYLRAINVTNGKEIWKNLQFVSGFSGGAGIVEIADGCLMAGSDYDNRMYVYGKGPSSITVSTPDIAVPRGTQIVIKGTVTDQSPGAKGTPAISDADQEAWMEYIYLQQAMPNNVKGVQVHLTAIDPNGNFQDIGSATSDIGGSYGTSWVPPVEGKYQVKATFEGSESYGSSYATTVLVVGPAAAPAAVVTPTPTQTLAPTMTPTQTISPSPSAVIVPPNSGMPATTYIAIGAAIIIIVAAAAAIVLRKRK
jgi:hypothetical protein